MSFLYIYSIRVAIMRKLLRKQNWSPNIEAIRQFCLSHDIFCFFESEEFFDYDYFSYDCRIIS